jgi:hypothetical protein
MTADPHPRDDDPREPSGGSPAASACPLCGAATGATDVRCPECSMSLAGTGGRPGALGGAVIWWWALVLLAIYLVVLAIVALVPA